MDRFLLAAAAGGGKSKNAGRRQAPQATSQSQQQQLQQPSVVLATMKAYARHKALKKRQQYADTSQTALFNMQYQQQQQHHPLQQRHLGDHSKPSKTALKAAAATTAAATHTTTAAAPHKRVSFAQQHKNNNNYHKQQHPPVFDPEAAMLARRQRARRLQQQQQQQQPQPHQQQRNKRHPKATRRTRKNAYFATAAAAAAARRKGAITTTTTKQAHHQSRKQQQRAAAASSASSFLYQDCHTPSVFSAAGGSIPTRNTHQVADDDTTHQQLQAAAAAAAQIDSTALFSSAAAAWLRESTNTKVSRDRLKASTRLAAAISETRERITERPGHMMRIAPLAPVSRPPRHLAPEVRAARHDPSYWSAAIPGLHKYNSRHTHEQDEHSKLSRRRNRALLPPVELEEDEVELERRLAAMQQRNQQADIGGARAAAASAAAPLDIMALLDRDKLRKIRRAFLTARGRALDLDSFVDVIVSLLPADHSEELRFKMASTLCKFFRDCDINGDNSMDWGEFNNFIIDCRLEGAGASAAVAAFEEEETAKNGGDPNGIGGENALSSDALASREEIYVRNWGQHRTEMAHSIDHLVYVPQQDHLVVFERGVSRYRVVQADTSKPVVSIKAHNGEIAAAEYCGGNLGLLATSSTDHFIRFWDPDNGYASVGRDVPTEDTLVKMKWDAPRDLLYCSTSEVVTIRVTRGGGGSDMSGGNSIMGSSGGGGGGGFGGGAASLTSGGGMMSSGLNGSSVAAGYMSNGTYGHSWMSSFVAPLSGSALVNPSSRETFSYEHVGAMSGHHTDAILDLHVIDRMNLLVTGSMDRTIALWDVETQQLHSVLRGHSRGITSLAYHSQYRCLVSGAFENHVKVWNPYCAKVVCELKGHFKHVVSVVTVEDAPQVVTADASGVIKIWDIRNFACVQSIYVEDEREYRSSGLSTVLHIPRHKRIVSAGHKLVFHDNRDSYVYGAPLAADAAPTVCVRYNSGSGVFVTAAGCNVKVWSEADGMIVNEYRNVTKSEITAMCLDDAQRKIVVGDTAGYVYVLKLINGALMKMARLVPVALKASRKGGKRAEAAAAAARLKGSREISSLAYISGTKHIIATDETGTVSLLDETEDEVLPLLKSVCPHPATIVSSAKSENLLLFAVGCVDGYIQLWDYQTHMIGAELRGHACEITALAFLDPYPILVSGDSDGNICFWAVRPVLLKSSKCVLRLVNSLKRSDGGSRNSAHSNNRDSPARSSDVSGKGSTSATLVTDTASAVTAFCFWHQKDASVLFTADVHGFIKRWDIHVALQAWHLGPFHSDGSRANGNGSLFSTPVERTRLLSSTDSTPQSPYATLSSLEQESDDASDSIKEAEDAFGSLSERRMHAAFHDAYRKKHHKYILRLESAVQAGRFTCPPNSIRLVHAWHAHPDSIRDMDLVTGPPEMFRGLATCSFDRTVRLWGERGAPLGLLRPLNTPMKDEFDDPTSGGRGRRPAAAGGDDTDADGAPTWVFRGDVESRIKRDQEDAAHVMSRLQLEKFSGKEKDLSRALNWHRQEKKAIMDASAAVEQRAEQPVNDTVFLTQQQR